MRTALILAVIAIPTFANAQTYPTTNNRSNTISGDIDGSISGQEPVQKRYYYNRSAREKPGCQKARNGNVICN